MKRPTDDQFARLREALADGLELHDAALLAELDPGQVKRAVWAGRSARPSSVAHRMRAVVLAGGVEYRRRVQQALLVHAESGNPRALATLATSIADRPDPADEMPEPEEGAPKIDWVRYRLHFVRRRIEQSAGGALTRLLAEERRLIEQIQALSTADPAAMDADEWRAYIEADARQAELADLEVYVEEYLRRTGAKLVLGEQTG